MRDRLEESPEERRRNVEREFWARHKDNCAIASEYKPLLDAVVHRVRRLAEKRHLDARDFDKKLREAEEVLEDVTFALKANWQDAPDHRFWYGFHDSQLIERPESWSHASPVSPRLLDAATARYLVH